MFFCIPILIGCSTRVKPEGDLTPRVCPRCHNAAVQPAKSRMWFELCFVPLVPLQSKRVWICPVCQWSLPIQNGWQPQVVGDQFYGQPQQQGLMSPQAFQSGYSPAYAPDGHQPGYTEPARKQT